MNWSKIIECVPNFSEGRDLEKIDKIVAPFRGKSGVKLLDYSNDEDHNRLVVTLVGEPEALRDAVIEAIGIAVRLIDLNHHSGQHPRMGAVVFYFLLLFYSSNVSRSSGTYRLP